VWVLWSWARRVLPGRYGADMPSTDSMPWYLALYVVLAVLPVAATVALAVAATAGVVVLLRER
jgi:hypothetical protein